MAGGFVLAVAGAWWLGRQSARVAPPSPSAPVPAVAAAVVADAGVLIALPPPPPSGAPPLPTDIEVKEPLGFDGGMTMDVAIEVFDEKGHLAGGTLVFKNPPCLPDGGAGIGAVEVEARTNVMGFARVSLVPGTWELESFKASPQRIEVGWGSNSFVVKMLEWVPAPVEGVVVDAAGQPVPHAKVMVQGAPPAAKPKPHDPPALELVAEADAQGRFALKTFGPGLTVVAAEGVRQSPAAYVPAGTKSAQLILADLPR